MRVERAVERAIEKFNLCESQDDAAKAAVDAANAEAERCRIISERMSEWEKYPDVLTPFPWPDAAYVLPCNFDDLEYYETCPRGFPAGVREWKERFYAHHRSIGLPLE